MLDLEQAMETIAFVGTGDLSSHFEFGSSEYSNIDNFVEAARVLLKHIKDNEPPKTTLQEYHWNTEEGYLGGIDFMVVAENLEKALEYAKEYLSDHNFKDLTNFEVDVSPLIVKKSGYHEYHMNPGG